LAAIPKTAIQHKTTSQSSTPAASSKSMNRSRPRADGF
jgi:hypothetical protein